MPPKDPKILYQDFSDEEIKRIEQRWKSDVDLKLDRMIAFLEKYEPYLESATRREKKRAEFWERMGEHAAKWGMISLLTGAFYALYLGAKTMVRASM